MWENEEISDKRRNAWILIAGLSLAFGLIYYFSNLKPQHYYDYTFRVAENILRGSIAFREKPPSWLNEFVPFEGGWYSVFPLGGVVSMMPFAVLKIIGAVEEMPGAFISALSAAVIGLFLLLIARRYDYGWDRRILLSMAILFGSWMWVNETMAGAWQLALGFAMIGELGAIYFTVYDRRPFLAGLFFAMAFGNRTENLLTTPIMMFLLFYRPQFETSEPDPEAEAADTEETSAKKKKKHKKKAKSPQTKLETPSISSVIKTAVADVREKIFDDPQSAFRTLAAFCAAPFVLGVLTLVYNYVRFHSFTDFGYARIPGVLDEPWYNHGIFSLYYIPGQAWEMLWKPWETKNAFPYLLPNGFSSSILWSSPFVLYALRFGARDRVLKYASWLAIFVLTFLLWMHGNSGGWQFGYRYAMVLLPWLFVILLESSPKKITPIEWAAYGLSFIINAYAVYLFHWSGYMKV